MSQVLVALAVCAWPAAQAGDDLPPYLERARFLASGDAGGDGVDAASDVHLDEGAHITAVGSLDGPAGHGADAYLVHLQDDVLLWDARWDSGPVGAATADSVDIFDSVAIHPTGVVALCGRFGGPGTAGAPVAWHWLQLVEPDGNGMVDHWSWTAQDGPGSLMQSCHSVAWLGNDLLTAGSSEHVPTQGRWWMHRAPGLGGPPVAPMDWGLTQGNGGYVGRPEALAVDPVSGAWVVAGSAAGSPPSESSALVVFHDPSGTVSWSVTHVEEAGLARAVSATIGRNGDVTIGYVVAGKVPAGLVVRYSAAGDGSGGPREQWRSGPYQSLPRPHVDEDNGTVWFVSAGEADTGFLGGFAVDAATGVDTHLLLVQDLPRPLTVTAVSGRGDRLAIAGSIVGPDDTQDFAVFLLEADDDDDGTMNSRDGCPVDPRKQEPGTCGCGLLDIGDMDDDGTLDCVDRCATDPFKSSSTGVCGCGVRDVDTDGDAWLDCQDACPADPSKALPGECGCGVADRDSDLDRVVDCQDACPDTPGTEESTGCPTTAPPVCGCASPLPSAPAGGGIGLLLWLVAGLRRRALRA